MPNTYYIQDDGTIDRMETHPQNPLPPTLQQRLEAAEREAAALREQLATAQNEIEKLQQAGRDLQMALYERKGMSPLNHREEYAILELNRSIGHAISHDERWSFLNNDETPLGQALDGLGDEVEP